jgi:hypothetical protein
VAAEDGWGSTIHGWKKDGSNKRLDEDKKQDSKEKEEVAMQKKVQIFS